jgi:hypothetical protein
MIDERNRKKYYRKPTLTAVVLVPEENVLSVCQDGTGTGRYPNPLGCLGPTDPCQDEYYPT